MTRQRLKSALWLTINAINLLSLIICCTANTVQINTPKYGDRLAPRRTFNSHLDNKLIQKDNIDMLTVLLYKNRLDTNDQKNLEYDEVNQSQKNVHRSNIEDIPEYASYQIVRTAENIDNSSSDNIEIISEAPIIDNTKVDYLINYKNSTIENLKNNKNLHFNHDDVKLNIDNQLKLESNISSSAQAHRLEMSTEFFVVPSTKAAAIGQLFRSTTVRPDGVIFATKTSSTIPTIILRNIGGLRKEPWVVPILALSCVSMLLMAGFEVFVLVKAWKTIPSRRHLFLGQTLLLGLFSCSCLAAVLTADPTPLTCGAVRFGSGVAFTLVFASLLVKCVFLISLNGGVYLPAPYQALLLLFAVLIQIAIGTQWLITAPPYIDNVVVPAASTAISNRYHLLLSAGDLSKLNPTIPLCHTPFSDLLLSLIYVVFLIIFVSILAIKSRGIRDNYREATYIGLAIAGAVPIWFGWTLCGLSVTDRHRDACLAFGLVATSSTVFLVMYMPKGRQLAAMGKEGLYVEDREEQFSSLSRAGSGYSPSFFHFKPIKYGMVGQSQSPSPNTNTTNGYVPSKNQAVASLGGGK